MAPSVAMAWSSAAPESSKFSVTSPSGPRASTVALRVPTRQALPPSPKTMRSPCFSRFAGRARASQRCSSSLSIKFTEIWATAPSRFRVPSSSAGITRVSLNTRASPGDNRSGRSAIIRSARRGCPSGSTTSSFAASRGLAGRNAINASGRSKSKSSTRTGDRDGRRLKRRRPRPSSRRSCRALPAARRG